MAETLQLDIVTPERPMFSAQVTQVEVPGVEGDFGVLPGHMPLISTVRPGVITVHGEHMKRYFITSGYAEVNNESCTILSEHVRDLTELTRHLAEEEMAHAKRVLEHATDETERAHALEELIEAEALLAAL